MLASDRVTVLDIPNLDAAPYYTDVDLDEPYPYIRLPSGHLAIHLTHYYDVKVVLSSPSVSRLLCNVEGGPTFLPGTTQKELLLNLDDPDHARARSIVTNEFSSRGIETLKHVVDTTARRGISEILCGRRPPDLFSSVLEDVTSTAVCHILGIPLEDRQLFQQWSRIIQIAPVDDLPGIEYAVVASREYLMDFVAGRRSANRDGFIRRYIDTRSMSKTSLTDEEFVGVLLGILLGGDHNALSVMTKCIYSLLCARSLWSQLLSEPNNLPDYIEELIRLIPIGTLSSFPRITTKEIKVSAGIIPSGSILYANTYLANRDPEVFPDPLAIDASRVNVRSHIQFGCGIHSCMGPALARLEISVVLKALMSMIPSLALTVEPGSLRWINGTVLRRPDELPITFDT